MKLHQESYDVSNPHRQQMLDEVLALIATRQAESRDRRAAWFRPDTSSAEACAKSLRRYRRELVRLLGWPLTLPRVRTVPAVREEPVATDDLGHISRLWIETLPGLHTYGLLFTPPAGGRAPLVICQHGGMGVPELTAGFPGDSANYNDMIRRVQARGCVVFAPQLLLWHPPERGPAYDRQVIERRLKHLGGSVAALELYRHRRALDYLLTRPEVDRRRVGMIGLSYGGFYTLFAAALDERLQAAVSSCWFNDRLTYDWYDWVWQDAANRMLDAEVACLAFPRALYVEVGATDPMFKVENARPHAELPRRLYDATGLGERFAYVEHGGGHELDKQSAPIDFLMEWLGA